MEKDRFIKVLKNYSESSKEVALEVLSLKESFPYSQLLHTLSARVSKDHGFLDHQQELQLAAIYAADRGVLKDVMTLDNLVVIDHPKQFTRSKAKSAHAAFKDNAVTPPIEHPEPGSLAEEVMHDLEKLHQLKQNFETLFVDSGSAVIKTPTQKEGKQPEEEATHHTELAKSKKERIIELAKALETAKETVATEDSKPKAHKKKEHQVENIIEEIVSTKQEITPESDKQKEQLQIIEKFIKTQPTISHPRDKIVVVPVGDLATIKTGEFSDNVVSETLVEILVKQDKKDKAIEVLKKLIWKFPQKKAYFAAQIEELRK